MEGGASERGFASSGFSGYQWREGCQRRASPLQTSLIANGERGIKEVGLTSSANIIK